MIITVASGKGGTGKTLVSTSLALALQDRETIHFLDCDVEEPNADIFLKPVFTSREKVLIPVPLIDEETCTHCGVCADICVYNAIAVLGDRVLTFPELCHGCGACSYLCPAGALLSLLNRVAALRRYMPAKKFGKCEFGLTTNDKMDCIYCDKCRYEQFSRKKVERKEIATVFLTCVAAAAIFVSAVSVDRFLMVIGTDLDAGITSASAGQPRDVDVQRVRRMIDEKRLSDKEAEYYKQIE